MSTELAKTEPKKMTLRQNLESESFRSEVAKALPKHLKPERFIRVATTALTRVPKLAKCDQRSFFKALVDLSSYGLEPDGRRAHLIPFENRKAGIVECQLIIDYKGLAELALRSGIIAKLHADLVCDKDIFEYNCGTVTRHTINFREPRGDWYAAYAIAETKDGSMFCQVMTKDEIHAIRNNSQGYKAAKKFGSQSPWDTAEGEMAKKTVFRRLSKWLPLSPEFRDAVARDEEGEEDYETKVNNAKAVESVNFELPENPLDNPPEADDAQADQGAADAFALSQEGK